MKYLKSYKIFEALGVAEATLIYNQFLVDEFNKYFDSFSQQDKQSDKSKSRNYSKNVSYDSDDLIRFSTDKHWDKFPIKKMSIVYSFKVIPELEFKKKYTISPKTNKNNQTEIFNVMQLGSEKKYSKFITTGACYPFSEGGSEIMNSHIHLKIELGVIICQEFSEVDRDKLSLDIESTINHELNHGYEAWQRKVRGKGDFSTDLTYSLDINRNRIKKEIWEVWYNKIGYYIYWSEPFEINAMIQDTLPYVKKFDVEKMKEMSPTWSFSKRLREFSAGDFKNEIEEVILSVYPDADVDFVMDRLKNGFANQLEEYTTDSEGSDKPTLKAEKIKKMSVDKFLDMVEKRVNEAGQKIQRGILRLYSRN